MCRADSSSKRSFNFPYQISVLKILRSNELFLGASLSEPHIDHANGASCEFQWRNLQVVTMQCACNCHFTCELYCIYVHINIHVGVTLNYLQCLHVSCWMLSHTMALLHVAYIVCKSYVIELLSQCNQLRLIPSIP